MPKILLRCCSIFCILIFLSVSLSGCKTFRRFFGKKKSPQKVEQKTTPPSSVPSPETAPLPPPTLPSRVSPETLPSETMETRPSAGQPQGGEVSAGPGLPEAAGTISVSSGTEKKVAEGTYFLIDDAQASSALGKPLSYQWSLVEGPSDRLQMVKANVLQGTFKILEMSEPTVFVLRLTASDGTAQASSTVRVTAYPARLELKSHVGGITRQVERLGEMTYVSRGRTLEIYDPQFTLLEKVNIDNPILEMTSFTQKAKNYLYVLTEAGEWMLLDVTEVKSVGKSLIQKVDDSFHHLKVVTSGEEAWALSMDRQGLTLWSLSDVLRPEVKLELKGPYKGLKKAVLWGKKLYLADRESLHSVDATSGIVSASTPIGGAVTGLEVIQAGGKSYLVTTLGEESHGPKKGDYGLRVFEIGVGGRLMNEQRFHLKGNPAIEKLHAIPATSKLLLGASRADHLEMRLFDLTTKGEIPLDIPSDFKLAILFDMATGELKGIPVAILADASSMRVLKLNPTGTPPVRYKVEVLKSSYSTLAAGEVKIGSSGTSVFLLDFGSVINPFIPALLEISTTDLSIRSTLVLGDSSYLSDFILTSSPRFNFATNLNDQQESVNAQTQGSATESAPEESRGINEGSLRVFSMEAKGMKSALVAKNKLGGRKGANESRAFGIDAVIQGTQGIVAVAVGKVSGVGVGTGLTLFRFSSDSDGSRFLGGPAQTVPRKTSSVKKETSFLSKESETKSSETKASRQDLSHLSLGDARDVKITSNGKWALVAMGAEGLAVIDLEKEQTVAKTNPAPGTFADRLLLSHDEKKVFVSFLDSIQGSRVSCVIYIYYFDQGKLGLWGKIEGLGSVSLPYGLRTGSMALTTDDLYLFVANGREGLWAYNASDPTGPVLISKLPTYGEAAGVTVGQKYKDIYIADLINGLEVAEFGF